MISNRFIALENLNDEKDINSAWENITGNIKTLSKESLGLHVSTQHKSRFDEYLRCLNHSKQTKTQLLQNPNQRNVDNLNNVRSKTLRHFRNKKKENLKAKIEEAEANSKIRILGNCVGASVTLRRVTSIELM